MPEDKRPQEIWYVYIIRTVSDTLYTGITTDPGRRFAEHCAGGARSARYLRAHPPKALAFIQAAGDRQQASRIEYALKQLPRQEKEIIISRQNIDFDPDAGMILLP